jgi:hypothetical protein
LSRSRSWPKFGRRSTDDLAEARRRIGGFFEQLPSETKGAEPASDEQLPFDVPNLIARAEAKLDEAGEEDRTELIDDLIETIRDARAAGNRERLAEACEQLKDLIFYLET